MSGHEKRLEKIRSIRDERFLVGEHFSCMGSEVFEELRLGGWINPQVNGVKGRPAYAYLLRELGHTRRHTRKGTVWYGLVPKRTWNQRVKEEIDMLQAKIQRLNERIA
jgi:hypothetical protein